MGHPTIEAVSWVAPPARDREAPSTAAVATLHADRVLVLADAIGPRARASGAAGHAIRAFVEAIPVVPRLDDVGRVVLAAMQAANSTVALPPRGSRNLTAPDAVALIAAIFVEDRIVVAHVGNCRCQRIRDGVLTPMTRDHSAAQELRGGSPETRHEAASDPFQMHHRDLLTRGLGLDVVVQPEIAVSDCSVADRYLLCTAEVWSRRSPRELQTALGSPCGLRDAYAAMQTGAGPRGVGGAFMLAEVAGRP